MALAIGLTQKSTADEVLDWNHVFNQAIVKSTFTSAISFRQAAIVHASIFDALNGIERRYQPIHVTEVAPRGASRRAAVIQAAYASMLNMFPDQKPLLDAQLSTSLAALADDEDGDARFGDAGPRVGPACRGCDRSLARRRRLRPFAVQICWQHRPRPMAPDAAGLCSRSLSLLTTLLDLGHPWSFEFPSSRTTRADQCAIPDWPTSKR
jgi:hypothetical protein